jgi:hypothetical protein
VRRRQDVDEIDLQQAELANDAGEIARAGRALRAGAVETLGGERYAAGFAQREIVRHLAILSRVTNRIIKTGIGRR